MTVKILCVDDEPNILAGYQRSLRKQFQIETAGGGAEALDKIAAGGPYAVLVTDMRMPGMDGIAFLQKARETAPDAIRIMLTGNADQQTATDAVNEGHIFRFLNKPCPPETLAQALTAALEQHRLVTAEKELLEKTLGGAIRMLMEILATVDPEMFGRAQALRRNMRLLIGELRSSGAPVPPADIWAMELAAMLAQIGAVTVPPIVADKVRRRAALTETEAAIWARVPETGYHLLQNIPRLEPVALSVRFQRAPYDGAGAADGAGIPAGPLIPLGARLLKVLLDLADWEAGGNARPAAFALMARQASRYDPDILAAARRCLIPAEPVVPKPPSVAVPLKGLCAGHVLAEDIATLDGKILLTPGRRLTEMLLEKLHNYAELAGIREPLYVQVLP